MTTDLHPGLYDGDDQDADGIPDPDPALVTRIAKHVIAFYGTSHTGKVSFAQIEEAVAAAADLAAELDALPVGECELLLDDVQTEIG